MNIKRELEKLKIKPKVEHDQFFLTDNKILDKIVDFADLNQNDVVLEVGAGVGNLTQKLQKKQRVISF